MLYYRYIFQADPALAEPLLAWLSELPFEGFEETSDAISGFLPGDADRDVVQQALAEIAEQLPFSYSVEAIPPENWNAVWEQNFQPVQVGAFCGIRAEFHPPFDGVRHELVIQPKMAFGTGHHETTYMVVEYMADVDFHGKRVFDYGCGTGILAILAAKLGAHAIDAVDIESAAVENAIENAGRNGVSYAVYQGTLTEVPTSVYDIILANINRNVILDSLSALYNKLPPGGDLIISGILGSDKETIQDAAIAHGFQWISQKAKGNWIAAKLRRP
ncbi:MAG: 50S ribosomal protein L11 methyltransferase [Haliscomenobacter sp.]